MILKKSTLPPTAMNQESQLRDEGRLYALVLHKTVREQGVPSCDAQ